MNEKDALRFAQDLQAGAKERICSDERIESTPDHEVWYKCEDIYDMLGRCAVDG